MLSVANKDVISRVLDRSWLPAAANGLMLVLAGALLSRINDYLCLGIVYCVATAQFAADLNNRRTVLGRKSLSNLSELTYTLYMVHAIPATVIISFVFPKLFGHSADSVIASVLIAMVLRSCCPWWPTT